MAPIPAVEKTGSCTIASSTLSDIIFLSVRGSVSVLSVGIVQLIFYQNFLLSFSAPIIMLDELSQVHWYVRCVLFDQAIVLLTKSFIPDGWVSTYTYGMYVWYSIRKRCSVKLWVHCIIIIIQAKSTWACITTSIWYRQWGNVSFQISSVTQRQPQPFKCETIVIIYI